MTESKMRDHDPLPFGRGRTGAIRAHDPLAVSRGSTEAGSAVADGNACIIQAHVHKTGSPPVRILLFVLSLLALKAVAAPAVPDLLTQELALELAGEATQSGSCTADIVPAPDVAPDQGMYSVRLAFRLDQYRAQDWLDCFVHPVPPLDLSSSRTVRLWIRAGQSSDCLMVKIVDPQNPGTNHSALETALLHNGFALPAGTWVPLILTLPEDPARRDGVSYLGFYVSASNKAVPLNTDIVFHLGRFKYELPERPPWPPEPERGRNGPLEPVFEGALAADGPWVRVGGKDNQTDHLARFVDGGVEFRADAPGWNEFLWSDPIRLVLRPLTTYRLQFDYRVLAPPSGGDDAMFYSLVRARGTIREDVGWHRWQGAAGAAGRRLITFTTHDMPDYYLNFGVRHHGAIRLEDLRIWEVAEGGKTP